MKDIELEIKQKIDGLKRESKDKRIHIHNLSAVLNKPSIDSIFFSDRPKV